VLGLENDLINAGFEFFGIWFLLHNCQVVLKDKKVAGVSVTTVAFWMLWGGWNVYYYPSLGQTFSFYCGIGVLLANILYVGLLIYYSLHPKE
jgi:hypothetical protein